MLGYRTSDRTLAELYVDANVCSKCIDRFTKNGERHDRVFAKSLVKLVRRDYLAITNAIFIRQCMGSEIH